MGYEGIAIMKMGWAEIWGRARKGVVEGEGFWGGGIWGGVRAGEMMGER